MARALPKSGPRVSVAAGHRPPQRTFAIWLGNPAGEAPWPWTARHSQRDPPVDRHWDSSALGPFVHTQGRPRLSLIGNLYFPKVVMPNLHHSLPVTHRQVWQGLGLTAP